MLTILLRRNFRFEVWKRHLVWLVLMEHPFFLLDWCKPGLSCLFSTSVMTHFCFMVYKWRPMNTALEFCFCVLRLFCLLFSYGCSPGTLSSKRIEYNLCNRFICFIFSMHLETFKKIYYSNCSENVEFWPEENKSRNDKSLPLFHLSPHGSPPSLSSLYLLFIFSPLLVLVPVQEQEALQQAEQHCAQLVQARRELEDQVAQLELRVEQEENANAQLASQRHTLHSECCSLRQDLEELESAFSAVEQDKQVIACKIGIMYYLFLLFPRLLFYC